MTNQETPLKTGPVDIVKYRWHFLIASFILLLPGLYFIFQSMITYPTHSPVRLGIDFTGGTILEYAFEKKLTSDNLPEVREIFEDKGYHGSIVQVQEPRITSTSDKEKKEEGHNVGSIVSIRTKQLQGEDATKLQNALSEKYGKITLLQKNSVGPTLADELLTNAIMALLLAYLLIVGYLSFRFQFDFAVCAILALIHDTVFVIGMFSMFGYLFHTEVDSMFVTAVLTAIGFSVHDTIVVFDRIRENSRVYYSRKLPFADIVNMSVNQTLVRSINTSLTALLTLVTLYLFGGETTKDFTLAIILGIAVGTFSSIFNASLLLAWWREHQENAKVNAIPT